MDGSADLERHIGSMDCGLKDSKSAIGRFGMLLGLEDSSSDGVGLGLNHGTTWLEKVRQSWPTLNLWPLKLAIESLGSHLVKTCWAFGHTDLIIVPRLFTDQRSR